MIFFFHLKNAEYSKSATIIITQKVFSTKKQK